MFGLRFVATQRFEVAIQRLKRPSHEQRLPYTCPSPNVAFPRWRCSDSVRRHENAIRNALMSVYPSLRCVCYAYKSYD